MNLSELAVPIVQAPMAGGPSTVELAAAVGRAGGLGFLAAGYKTASAMIEEVQRLRASVDTPFGVNLFVPQALPDRASVAPYQAELAGEAIRYGVELPELDFGGGWTTDHWDDKIAFLVDHPVPVVSFTFDLPSDLVTDDLHRGGSYLVGTVTSVAEARAAVARGMDALCVQGPEAGGHRGIHDPFAEPGRTPLLNLLAEIGAETTIPLIAAGGLMTGTDIATALRGGALAVQLGTAYLRTPESGAAPAYKAALIDPRFSETVVTRAFSGRPARGLRNRFIAAHDATAPAGYPLVNQLTRPLRAAAAKLDDPDGLALWTGTGHHRIVDNPAEALTERLWQDARTILGRG
ncbi:MAG TPA: nitronate monooxygenase [Pseudonocardiaceae bacterium]|nr:nitronate monooxygenase [Pseudonocardiaceae bacterium]